MTEKGHSSCYFRNRLWWKGENPLQDMKIIQTEMMEASSRMVAEDMVR